MTRRSVMGSAVAALAAPAVRRAQAEASEVFIAKQFGTLYLQQDVMEQQKLIEKHAAQFGLPGLKAHYVRLAGTGPVTDALLSGKLQFASGGAPGAMLLWDRTRGGIKSCFAMNAATLCLRVQQEPLYQLEHYYAVGGCPARWVTQPSSLSSRGRYLDDLRCARVCDPRIPAH